MDIEPIFSYYWTDWYMCDGILPLPQDLSSGKGKKKFLKGANVCTNNKRMGEIIAQILYKEVL